METTSPASKPFTNYHCSPLEGLGVVLFLLPLVGLQSRLVHRFDGLCPPPNPYECTTAPYGVTSKSFRPIAIQLPCQKGG
ncbi:hypothetical protein JAAARDRAFT_36027 [Jaapia argillacea MUCL 33604]|uniref:Uncharacterized protein n=1 Tax=Jaapia argillacea MUCL 33604 TaxID=933084 RepID=A0A067PRT0_9AGAM|nr:hypothetical protein JAAARDRAFT_36027 [Jaapia argillacea MUCL 33604]